MTIATVPQWRCGCANEIARLNNEIIRLEWDETVGMFNAAGGYRAMDALAPGAYALIFCDIDYLKQINSATQNHVQTNRYIGAGLRVRRGEIAMRLMGDEFLFVLRTAKAGAFVARLTRQLATQPLTSQERAGLPSGVLSATFAYRVGVRNVDFRATIEVLSQDVLGQKEARI